MPSDCRPAIRDARGEDELGGRAGRAGGAIELGTRAPDLSSIERIRSPCSSRIFRARALRLHAQNRIKPTRTRAAPNTGKAIWVTFEEPDLSSDVSEVESGPALELLELPPSARCELASFEATPDPSSEGSPVS